MYEEIRAEQKELTKTNRHKLLNEYLFKTE